tara:strand:- start:6496 stop:6909 length:414 start_codon:yes stop_codon:yes gene_type:complete
MKAKKSNPSGKVGTLLKRLEASSSKRKPQIAPEDTRDHGERKHGSTPVSQGSQGRRKKEPSIMGPSYKQGGKTKGGMSGLDAAEKQVYRRGLAAYMSSGNRPKVSQHAWAMARVKSAFGKREAAKIRAGKSGKGKKK